MSRPLDGLRVLDSADEKGEFCGRILADLGADVIRVEPPGGALSRRLPPFAPDGETSLYFAVRNAGKRGISLDLEDADGRERLHRLLARSDVWIESGPPAVPSGSSLMRRGGVQVTPRSSLRENITSAGSWGDALPTVPRT